MGLTMVVFALMAWRYKYVETADTAYSEMDDNTGLVNSQSESPEKAGPVLENGIRLEVKSPGETDT